MTLTPLMVFAASLASAGYGDVDEEGRPSWAERDMHLWTNAVRVDPEAFRSEYEGGGCSFDSFLEPEKVKLPPLSYDSTLNEAARFHSTDMNDNNHFAHESSDGTPFGERISRFYDSGFAGENIAVGYPDTYNVVTSGWMCSDGHRANIMLDGYTELGTGVVGSYYTQNFGGGGQDTTGAVYMAVHEPASATHDATFLADWSAPEAPARLQVVIDGEPYDMELAYGDEDQGVYEIDAAPEDKDCHQYYISWAENDGTEGVFPEEGSYTYGPSCDTAYDWIAGHMGSGGGSDSGSGGEGSGSGGTDSEGNPLTAGAAELTGCSALGSAGTLWLALGGLGLVGLRRRD